MSKKLVIVESPAKAKTISRFLGSDYVVEASVGHIRDLPTNRKGLPKELQKKWWADYAVDVDQNFEPFYEVPSDKQKYVARLKDAMKGITELVLATDEDREGESISWHLLQVLKPPKSVLIKRIAFHEITREAILEALNSPRPIDEELVEAQEARRILDRLYGYTLSPVLWTKVAKELSAGRVQSPAVKLIVEREKRRRDFVTSVYWDLKAEVEKSKQPFFIQLKSVAAKRVASGKDFDELTGKLRDQKALVLEESSAKDLATAAKEAKPWLVTDIQKKPGKESPPPPFRTTTLQQEANRKFGFSADRTMRIAQDLYEGVEVRGERVGLITYMRTDSLNLAEVAVKQARDTIKKKYGLEHLPDKPNRYASKVANAQEAHEAVRPTDFDRAPDSIRNDLERVSKDHYRLYELIYRRTLACQMKPADVMRTQLEVSVDVQSQSLTFGASGKEILFPGFLLAYVEDVDDAEQELEGKESLLPELKKGDEVSLLSVTALRHETRPPARFTEASLIKALEELGIGRPSTYASIISVIIDRGYVNKKGRELIPTFVAFLTIDMLNEHFPEFVDLAFTAKMDETLDEIANGKEDSKEYLRDFFLGGESKVGLRDAVEKRKREIPFPVLSLGEHPESKLPIILRLGKDGSPFIQLGTDGDKVYANVPDDMEPDELSAERAVELLNKPKSDESIGIHPQSGRRLLLKKRQGYYLEVERTPEEIEAKVKPTWVSLPSDADPYSLSQEDLNELCLLPKVIGHDPDSGNEIIFRLGKFGPYIQSGKEIRNVDQWRTGITMSVSDAMALLSVPKMAAARQQRQAAGPIQDFGELEGASGPVRVLAGRYGPYVTDGSVNATIPKNMDAATITADQALEMIKAKVAAGPSPKKKRFSKAKKGTKKK